jgi:uncharacterized membrane protein
LTWTKNTGAREFLLIILGLHLLFYAVVFLGIPVARQVIGFVYLTFVPGIIIFRLLKIGSSSWPRRVLFSVGFSMAFLLFAGLLINTVGPTIGISQPLSLIPLIVTLTPVVLLLAFISCFRKDDKYMPPSIDRKSVLSVAFLVCLPIMAVIGAVLMNVTGNNLILLLLIIAISVCFSVGVLSKKLKPQIYVLIILVVALALLYHSVVMSNYIMGGDAQVEYYIFNLTNGNKFWSSTLPQYWDITYGRFNSMLSVTILPTIYSSVMDINPTWVLKIVFPIVFSLVPVGLFLMWKPYTGMKRAFFAVFLFMAQLTFYTEMTGLNRQMLGELFLILLFMVLLSKKMGSFNRNLYFIIFGAALVVSHYALSYIFMFFIAFAWALSYVLRRNGKIKLPMVIIFLLLTFSWYIFTSNASSFESLLDFGDSIVSNISDFANFGSRSEGVLKGIGLASSPTILNTVSRIIAYVIQAFIVLGFVSVVTKKTNIRFNREYIAFALVSMSMLVFSILVPGFANTLNVERIFHISLIFLAPFCVIGAEVLIGVFTDFSSKGEFKLPQKLRREMRWKPTIFLLAILVLYFLFQTNFFYEVAGSESWSIPLSKQRLDPVLLHLIYGYIEESDVFGARWLVKNSDFTHTTLFAGGTSIFSTLTVYGMIYRGDGNTIHKATMLTANATIYLSRMNVVDGVMLLGPNLNLLNINDTSVIFSILDNTNKVYTNGACEIYETNG